MMEKYEFIETIGSGSFGTILKVRRASDKKILACKEIHYQKMSDKERKQIVTEVNVLRELRHPNIVRYYDRILDKERSILHIFMEYCEGGDLGEVIKRCRKEGRYLEEDKVWRILAQLVFALNECHNGRGKSPILHRDLKPANVFLDDAFNVKLGDFGLSRTLEDSHSSLAQTFVGTPYYQSPEQLHETGYDTKSDVWSLGCLIYELCSLSPPFVAANMASLSEKIKLGKFKQLPPQYSRDLDCVIRAMLSVDPSKRPAIEDFFTLSQIRLYQFEMTLKREWRAVRRKEEEVRRREESLLKMADELRDRERQLRQMEEEMRRRLGKEGNGSPLMTPHSKEDD